MNLTFDPDDYELRWPPQLFVDELTRLLGRPPTAGSALERAFGSGIDLDAVAWLLSEAFTSTVPAETLRKLPGPIRWGPQTPRQTEGPTASMWLEQLRRQATQWPEPGARKPYWSTRRNGQTAGARLAFPETACRFAQLVGAFDGSGYLAHALGQDCVDDNGPPVDPARILARHLGYPVDWPLSDQGDAWPIERLDVFCDLVEVLHDLVARPSERSWHDYSGCGWHYQAFATGPGRRLYRWRVNQLLASSTLGLQLADSGEDLGRLVRTEPSGLDDLAEQAMQTALPATVDRVQHAIALFRGRGATVEERRSAIITLAGILEERRSLLKAELLTRDEAAIFQLLNGFAIRHRRADQRSDYDPAFLDWLYRWCLATVTLVHELLVQQTTGQR